MRYQMHSIIPDGLFRDLAGWTLKRYRINAAAPAEPLWGTVRGLVEREPPVPPEAAPSGLGFVLLHRTPELDYLVLCRWTRVNELLSQVWVRTTSGGEEPWRPGEKRYSFCVWDLEVMAFEREAFLHTIYQPSPEPSAYLASFLQKTISA